MKHMLIYVHKPIKTNKKGTITVTRVFKKEAMFEQAFRSIELATWNRPRTSAELQSFLTRREAVVETVEL